MPVRRTRPAHIREDDMDGADGTYRLSLEGDGQALIVYDARTLEVVDASPLACRRFGYDRESMVGRGLTELSPGVADEAIQDDPDGGCDVDVLAPDGSPWLHLRADGSTFEAAVTSHRMVDEERALCLLTLHDVAAAVQPRRAARRQALFFRNMSDAVIISDLEGRIMEWNPAAEQIFGYRRSEVVGRVGDFLNPGASGPRLRRQILATVRRGDTWEGEVTIERNDGSRGRASLTVVPLRDDEGRVVASVGINRDVSAQRAAEAEAFEREARFRVLAEQIPHIVWIAGPDGSVEYYNRGFEAYSGRSGESGHGWGWQPIVHPDDEERTVEAWSRSVATGDEYAIEHRIRSADGSYRWHLSRGTPMRDEEGRVQRWFGSATDIHAQKMAEAAIREREAFYRAIFEHAHDGIFLYDPGTDRFVDLNAQAAALFGRTPETMRGERAGRFASALEDLRGLFEQVRREGRARVEIQVAGDDGDERVVEVNATLMESHGRPMGLGIMRDVTRQRRLQLQLHHVQRMESIGRLAGGVAHDFNNILTAIQGFASFIQERAAGLHPEVTEATDEIIAASGRAGSLTRQLLAYGRQQVLDAEVLDLNELVTSTRRMLARLIGAHIDFRVELSPDLEPIYADAGQMQQVLVNLAMNARDAMPDGGELRVATRNEAVGEVQAAADPAAEPGRYAVVEVSDTGHGMDRETLAKVFDPFFTTKAPGEGTGLGLSTVYGIVRQSGGFVRATSETARGSSFRIHLPVTDRAPSRRPGRAEPARSAPAGGSRTVLVVEDEPSVRSVARRSLERRDFRVLEAGSGEEALEVLARTDGAVDLLLTDMVMPAMGGRELAERATRERPDLPVIFMSGYNRDFLARQAEWDARHTILEKPFTPDELVEVVTARLERG